MERYFNVEYNNPQLDERKKEESDQFPLESSYKIITEMIDWYPHDDFSATDEAEKISKELVRW